MDSKTLSKAIFPADFASLPKDKLDEYALSFNIDTGARTSSIEVAYDIYEKVNELHNPSLTTEDEFNKIKKIFYNDIGSIVFAGKTSVVWYKLKDNQKNINMDDSLIKYYGLDGFDIEKKVDINGLSNVPEIIKIIKISDKVYLMRMLAKTGVKRIPLGTGIEVQPLTTLFSTIINQDENFIEVRCDAQIAKKVIKKLTPIFQLAANDPSVDCTIVPYGVSIEKFAEQLNGKVIESVAKPEMFTDKMLTDRQLEAVGHVLNVVDEYFNTKNERTLIEQLEICKESINNEGDVVGIPFPALVLIGMEKLGLTALKDENSDLKNNPLFAILKPYLQQQGGCIRFPVNEDGVQVFHTIKVGIITNSIAFRTYATEEAINTVRSIVLKGEA